MYIFLRTDSIDRKFKTVGEEIRRDQVRNKVSVRRPYRGIQIKDDVYATLSIVDADNRVIPLTSESDINPNGNIGKVSSYSDFVIQSVEETREEKVQIIDTFGAPYVYFYGEKPRFTSFNGILMNTEDFNWRAQFWDNYEKYLRGTKLVQRNARAYLAYDSIVIEGYPITARASDDANMPYAVQFQLTMLVTNYFDYSAIGDVRFPDTWLAESVNVAAINRQLALKRGKYTSVGADVRFENFAARPSGGLIQNISKGISSAQSALGGVRQSISGLIGGRVMRMPIGIAGFFTNIGTAQFAAGSIDPSLIEWYDAQTGKYTTLTGSMKLRMPTPATFFKPNILRGFKRDNYDEYPTQESPPWSELLSKEQLAGIKKREAERKAQVELNDFALATWNMLAEQQGTLSKISDVVGAIKGGFGMVLAVSTALRDPERLFLDTFGLRTITSLISEGGGYKQYSGLYDYFKDGPPPPASAAAERAKNIGRDSRNTFVDETRDKYEEFLATRQEPTPEDLGSVYQSNTYTTNAQAAEEVDYESVYDNNDYTKLIDQAQTEALQSVYGAAANDYVLLTDSAEKSAIDEVYGDSDYISQAIAASPEDESKVYSSSDYARQVELAQKSTIDEVYGDNDYARSGSDITPAELDAVYNTGVQSSQARTPEQILAILQAILNGQDQTGEQGVSIRGRDSVDTEIEPIR